MSINFEWDDRKNESNIAKHGFDFADAPRIFDLPILVSLDDRQDYGEDRWIGIGLLDARTVVVVYTEIDEETIRTYLKVSIQVDSATCAWFQAQGENAEQQMAVALRIYAEAHKAYPVSESKPT